MEGEKRKASCAAEIRRKFYWLQQKQMGSCHVMELAVLSTTFPLWNPIWGVSQGGMLGHRSWYNDYIDRSDLAPHPWWGEAWSKNGLKLYGSRDNWKNSQWNVLGDTEATPQPKDRYKNQTVGGGGVLGGEFWLILCSVNTFSSGWTDGPSHDPAPPLLLPHGHLCHCLPKHLALLYLQALAKYN